MEVFERTTKKIEQRAIKGRKRKIQNDAGRVHWRKHTETDERKVCAVRYADEGINTGINITSPTGAHIHLRVSHRQYKP